MAVLSKCSANKKRKKKTKVQWQCLRRLKSNLKICTWLIDRQLIDILAETSTWESHRISVKCFLWQDPGKCKQNSIKLKSNRIRLKLNWNRLMSNCWVYFRRDDNKMKKKASMLIQNNCIMSLTSISRWKSNKSIFCQFDPSNARIFQYLLTYLRL